MKIRHVKLPVSDLKASMRWYRELLDLELAAEFAEQGVVRGVALKHADGFLIALREREAIAGKPSLDGFDVFALEVDDPAELVKLTERCQRLGIAYRGILDNGDYGQSLDIPDPDGTVVRFLYNTIVGRDGFAGFDFADGAMSIYHDPRL